MTSKQLFMMILINSLFLVSLYLGFVVEINGAINVALVIAWVAIVCTLFYYTDGFMGGLKGIDRPQYASYINGVMTSIVVLVFVFNSYIVVGVLYMIHAILKEDAWRRVQLLRDADAKVQIHTKPVGVEHE